MRRLAATAMLCAIASSCRTAPAPTATEPAHAAPSASVLSVAPGSGRRAEDAAAKKSIAGGKVIAGSVPGDEGRDPTSEPAAASYELTAYAIDALPYPGTPGTPARTGVSSQEAMHLCAERGGRLCTELEWERACRGPSNETFSMGNAWDPTCAAGAANNCASGFGVRAMGTALAEWTATTATTYHSDGRPMVGVVTRGASATAPMAWHRCASRHVSDAHSAPASTGFRCCYGTPNAAQMQPIVVSPTFRRATVDPAKLGDLLSQAPELARVRAGARCFTDTEGQQVVAQTKSRLEGWTLTTDPILWSPEPGAELLVLAGRARGGSFVAAFYPLADGRYRPASSLLFVHEQGPILLGYQSNLHREIDWSMAWGASGEGGAISYRDDHRAVVVQR